MQNRSSLKAQRTPMHKIPWLHLLIIVLIAAAGRALLLASDTVSFHSDEAIIALMARHINQGARPVFFYGQAYMGSLDAWLVALGFQVSGESVLSIRMIQSLLYLLVVATGYLAAWTLSGRRVVAAVAGLLLAVPTVNMALYTTATLGGYNETLLFGNLIVILGYSLVNPERETAHLSWRWLALGLVAGVAWWTNGLIVMTALPVALLMLVVWLRQRVPLIKLLPGVLLALVGFIVGSAPWWVFDFTHDHAALSTFISNRQTGEFEGIGIPYVPPPQRALGLVLIGLPTLVGMRFPWSAEYFLLPIGVVVTLLYGVAVYRLIRVYNPLRPHARLLALLMLLVFTAIFVASTFGADPTGRYFLPLALPLGIALGALVDDLARGERRPQLRAMAPVLVALVVGYQALGQMSAARSDVGFTTQFDLISHVPNTHDKAVTAFLEENELYHGHTNYWVAFRLAFLSGERLQYSASLPYKADLSYNAADKRYKPYVTATENAERIAYITTQLPALDEQLQAHWQAEGIRYQTASIGPYRIYYDFSAPPPPPSVVSIS